MKKAYMYVGIGIALCIILLVVSKQYWLPLDETVVKYFPLDDTKQLEQSSTSLTLLSESDKDEYDIQWKTNSTLAEPIYLRQDISLLYENGHLRGILSKWKESGQNVALELNVHGEDSGHYQAVTYHHGEVHYPDDKIKSIQDMSQAELYVVDSPMTPLESFQKPENNTQSEWKKTLDHATNQQLLYEWNQLINHFQIPKNDYESIPLTSLPDYISKPFPQLNQQQTQQVIGQLWEGLYKNYVLDFAVESQKSSDQTFKSYIPLILADKEGTHLLVLYENSKGKKIKLTQRYPDSPKD